MVPFHFIADRREKPKQALELKHGEPLIFGEQKEKGIALDASMSDQLWLMSKAMVSRMY